MSRPRFNRRWRSNLRRVCCSRIRLRAIRCGSGIHDGGGRSGGGRISRGGFLGLCASGDSDDGNQQDQTLHFSTPLQCRRRGDLDAARADPSSEETNLRNWLRVSSVQVQAPQRLWLCVGFGDVPDAPSSVSGMVRVAPCPNRFPASRLHRRSGRDSRRLTTQSVSCRG